MEQQNQSLTGTVSTIAFGGHGIIKQDEFVTFIPFTAIGDTVEYRLTEKRKKYGIGEVINIVNQSSDRVTPRCPYFGKCGGCQIQHLNYNAQLAYKQESLIDCLQRLGRLPTDSVKEIHPAINTWAYRRHVTLTLRPSSEGSGFEAGYIGIDDKSLVRVTSCPIFVDESDPILEQVQAVVSQLRCFPTNSGKVTILKQEVGQPLLHFHFETIPANCEEVFQAGMKEHEWAGVSWGDEKKSQSIGSTTTSWHIDGLKFLISPQAFSQNHPEQSSNIYRRIVEIAGNCKNKHVLDLYSGVGITSTLLAKQGANVQAIESSLAATRLAKENAKNNEVSKVDVRQGDVRAIAYSSLKQFAPNLLVVNPPRTGLDVEVVHSIISEKPQQIIYISCMPPTLARDLRLICARGYQIKSCEPYDMFPQTFHLETLVHLVL